MSIPRGIARAGRRRGLDGVLRCRRGEALIGFAFIVPLLVMISLAVMEFTMVLFDYHRAGEATRRAARLATIAPPAGDLQDYESDGPVTCTSSGGTLDCGAAGVNAEQSFSDMLAEMQAILPQIQAENVEVVYEASGVGDPDTPGGVLPMVTVRLTGLEHAFIVLDFIPGVPTSITYPTFITSYLASGKGA